MTKTWTRVRLGLALFRSSLLRTVITILALVPLVAMAIGIGLAYQTLSHSADDFVDQLYGDHDLMIVSSADGTLPTSATEEILAADPDAEFVIVADADFGEMFGQIVATDGPAMPLVGDAIPVVVSNDIRTEAGLDPGDSIAGRVGMTPVRFSVVDLSPPQGARFTAFTTRQALVAAGIEQAEQPTTALVDSEGSEAVVAQLREIDGVEVQDRETAAAAALVGLRPTRDALPIVGFTTSLLAIVIVFSIVRAATIAQAGRLLVLRAIGASDRRIVGLAAISALAYAMAGFAGGALLAQPIAEMIVDSIPPLFRDSGAPLAPPAWSWSLGLSAVAVAAVVSLLSARLAVGPVLNVSADEQLRSRPSRDRVPPLVGIVALVVCWTVAWVMLQNDPARFFTAANVIMFAGWGIVAVALTPVLFRVVDRLTRGTTAGFVSTLRNDVPAHLKSAALVASGALALMLALFWTSDNARQTTLEALPPIPDETLIALARPLSDRADFDPSVIEEVLAVPGVSEVRPLRNGYIHVGGERIFVMGLVEGSQYSVGQLGERASGKPLAPGHLYVSPQLATPADVDVGDTLVLPTAGGGELPLEVDAVVRSPLWPNGVVAVHRDDVATILGSDALGGFEIDTDGQIPPKTVAEEVIRAAQGWGIVGQRLYVETGAEVGATVQKDLEASDQLFRTLGIIGVLAAVILTTSTLVLDTAGRSAELGMVRSVGATSWQLTKMVATRGFAIVVVGLVIGVPLGYALGWVIAAVAESAQGVSIVPFWSIKPTLYAIGAGCLVFVISVAVSALRLSRASVEDLLGKAE